MDLQEIWRTAVCDANVVPSGITPKLLWTDPPFGTGKTQEQGGNKFFDPTDTNYVIKALQAWLSIMDPDGVVCVCCDYRLAPTLATELGWVFRGDVVWGFGLGRPRTDWWPVRHNQILTFTRTPTSGRFDKTAVPRERRLAPKKGYEGDKAAGSIWDYTFSNTNAERVGYPNQKPIKIILPFVDAHTERGDWVADPFCGSGSTGVAAIVRGRKFYGSDVSKAAIDTTLGRFSELTFREPPGMVSL